MSFGTKYELLETISSGRVQTYVARTLATGGRVLVHLLSSRRFAPGDIDVPGKVLEHLNRIAPPPPGEALDCGEYEGTHYAYLVTRYPTSPAEVQRWVEQYEAMPHTSTTSDLQAVRDPRPEVAPAPTSLPQKGEVTAILDRLMQHRSSAEEERKSGVTPAPAALNGSTSILGSEEPSPAEQPPPDRSAELSGRPARQPGPPTPASPQELSDTRLQFARMFGQAPPAAAQPAPSVASAPASEIMDIFGDVKSAPPAAPAAVPQRSMSPGEVTGIFGDAGKAETPRPPLPAPPVAPPSRPAGEFTRIFRAPLEPRAAGGSAPASPLPASEFTKIFASSPAPRSAPAPEPPSASLPATPTPAATPAPATPFVLGEELPPAGEGEFTQFFSSPFKPSAQKEAPSVPATPPPPPPRQEPGGFTKLFESPMQSSSPERRFEAVPLRREPGAFTRIFGAPSIARVAASSAAKTSTPAPSVGEPPPVPAPPAAVAPTPRPLVPATAAPTDATRVFTAEPSAAAPPSPVAPAGPSEFTRIVSGRSLQEAMESASSMPMPAAPAPGAAAPAPMVTPPVVTPPAVAAPQYSPPQVAAPQFTPPAVTPPMVSAPQYTPPAVTPPMVSAPQYTPPSVQAPQVYMPTPMPFPGPQYAPPPVPAPPPVAAPQPQPVARKTNYLPLIIILNVLFVLAVALVLYFALKH